MAIPTTDAELLNAARIEIAHALAIDFSSADLMLKLIIIDLKLASPETRKEAVDVLQVYKSTAKGSPIWRQLEPLMMK